MKQTITLLLCEHDSHVHKLMKCCIVVNICQKCNLALEVYWISNARSEFFYWLHDFVENFLCTQDGSISEKYLQNWYVSNEAVSKWSGSADASAQKHLGSSNFPNRPFFSLWDLSTLVHMYASTSSLGFTTPFTSSSILTCSCSKKYILGGCSFKKCSIH